jgi:hypothetical protein
MNLLLKIIIADQGLSDDGFITPDDMMAISSAILADPAYYEIFITAHGDDEGGVETGFHYLQGDGGTLMFQDRKFLDTVADAIYHYGFDIVDGNFLNEYGNMNEEVADVAGWLNYFRNGVDVV